MLLSKDMTRPLPRQQSENNSSRRRSSGRPSTAGSRLFPEVTKDVDIVMHTPSQVVRGPKANESLAPEESERR